MSEAAVRGGKTARCLMNTSVSGKDRTQKE